MSIVGPKVFELSPDWLQKEQEASAERSAKRDFRRLDFVSEAVTYFYVLPPWSEAGKLARSVWSGTVPKGWFAADVGRYFRSLKTWGKPCPVIASCDSVRQRVGKGGGQDWSLLNPRERVVMNVLPVGFAKVLNGVEQQFQPFTPTADMPHPDLAHITETPPSVYDKIITAMRAPGVGNITRPDSAVMCYVKKTGKDTDTKYDPGLVGTRSPAGFSPQRSSWYNGDTARLNAVLASMYDLDKLYPEPSEEQLKHLQLIAQKVLTFYGGGGPLLNAAGPSGAVGLTPFGMPPQGTVPGLPAGMVPFGSPQAGQSPSGAPAFSTGFTPPPPPAPVPPQVQQQQQAPPAPPISAPAVGQQPFTSFGTPAQSFVPPPPPPPPGAVPGMAFVPPPMPQAPPPPPPQMFAPPVQQQAAPPAPSAPGLFTPPAAFAPPVQQAAPPAPPAAAFQPPAQAPAPQPPPATAAPPAAPSAAPTASRAEVVPGDQKDALRAKLFRELVVLPGPFLQPVDPTHKPVCFAAFEEMQAGPNKGWCGDDGANKSCRFRFACMSVGKAAKK